MEVQGQALRQGDFLEGLLVGPSGQGSLCLVTLRLWTVFQALCLHSVLVIEASGQDLETSISYGFSISYSFLFAK